MERAHRRSSPFETQHTLARLVIEQGPGEGTIFPLYGERIVRLGSCDLQLDDGTVSRLHARLSQRQGDFVIEDLDSHAGTLVNDRAIDLPTLLSSGDRIALGQVLMRYER